MAGRHGRKVLEQAVKIAGDAVPADREIAIASEVKWFTACADAG